MPYWYAELFFIALLVFTPVAIVAECNGNKALVRKHVHMLFGCSLLAVSTGIDFAAHAWAWETLQSPYGRVAIMIFGFLPGSILVGLGVIRWINLTSGLSDEVARRKMAETELRHLTQKLEKAANEAAKANQDKSDFLANMSHELRTPLNAIIGFTELMEAEAFGKLGAPEYKEYLNIVHESGQQLLDVIGDLLDLNKIQAARMVLREENVDLVKILQQCAALKHEEASKKSVKISVTCNHRISLIADTRMIRQVTLNLLTNAISHSDAGQHIKMSAYVTKDHQVVMLVEDNGNGMTSADIERATMPFGHGDSLITRSHERAALGLSLVNTFVELHEGILMIDSQRGAGTLVTVKFPTHRALTDEQSMQAEEEKDEVVGEPLNTGNVAVN